MPSLPCRRMTPVVIQIRLWGTRDEPIRSNVLQQCQVGTPLRLEVQAAEPPRRRISVHALSGARVGYVPSDYIYPIMDLLRHRESPSVTCVGVGRGQVRPIPTIRISHPPIVPKQPDLPSEPTPASAPFNPSPRRPPMTVPTERKGCLLIVAMTAAMIAGTGLWLAQI